MHVRIECNRFLFPFIFKNQQSMEQCAQKRNCTSIDLNDHYSGSCHWHRFRFGHSDKCITLISQFSSLSVSVFLQTFLGILIFSIHNFFCIFRFHYSKNSHWNRWFTLYLRSNTAFSPFHSFKVNILFNVCFDLAIEFRMNYTSIVRFTA